MLLVWVGNSLSGGASIRLYGTQANAVVSGTTITVSFFGEVSSTGQIVGEPRTEVRVSHHAQTVALLIMSRCFCLSLTGISSPAAAGFLLHTHTHAPSSFPVRLGCH
jgi:hypothetical protein